MAYLAFLAWESVFTPISLDVCGRSKSYSPVFRLRWWTPFFSLKRWLYMHCFSCAFRLLKALGVCDGCPCNCANCPRLWQCDCVLVLRVYSENTGNECSYKFNWLVQGLILMSTGRCSRSTDPWCLYEFSLCAMSHGILVSCAQVKRRMNTAYLWY